MTRSIKFLGGAALAAFAVAAAVPMAHAQNHDDPAEARAFLSSGMTLNEAAAAAEAESGGTAMAASWENAGSGQMAFEVELAQTDGSVTTVLVDPGTGAVSTAANSASDATGMEGDDSDGDQQDEGGVEGDDD